VSAHLAGTPAAAASSVLCGAVSRLSCRLLGTRTYLQFINATRLFLIPAHFNLPFPILCVLFGAGPSITAKRSLPHAFRYQSRPSTNLVAVLLFSRTCTGTRLPCRIYLSEFFIRQLSLVFIFLPAYQQS